MKSLAEILSDFSIECWNSMRLSVPFTVISIKPDKIILHGQREPLAFLEKCSDHHWRPFIAFATPYKQANSIWSPPAIYVY
jgi:hypothetical protein